MTWTRRRWLRRIEDRNDFPNKATRSSSCDSAWCKALFFEYYAVRRANKSQASNNDKLQQCPAVMVLISRLVSTVLTIIFHVILETPCKPCPRFILPAAEDGTLSFSMNYAMVQSCSLYRCPNRGATRGRNWVQAHRSITCILAQPRLCP